MRLTVHLPEDLARLLREAAAHEGKSLSALTAEALAFYLRERRRAALGRKVLERAGKVPLGEEAFLLLEEGRRDRP
ncbi:MAG: ribbon-helix-helix protein, CopG family [Thermus sp.]|uniref:ribbon-helix-helix protein, CopG family n=1 Tax=Thermus sp. TaxID=275 RepID=UPI00298F121A|nr:ribbon-helix-helix protein, CopG family [Thermus sp.]MDW8018410.1 ribbon-helix-helix protein, CopG family [Thermus sp.]